MGHKNAVLTFSGPAYETAWNEDGHVWKTCCSHSIQMKLLTHLFFAIFCAFLPSCIAGGSSLHLKAKKHSGSAFLSMSLSAYGGANLAEYDTCRVEFSSGNQNDRKPVYAVVSDRKRECVEWSCSVPEAAFPDSDRVTTKIYSSSGKSRLYETVWRLSWSDLTTSYEEMPPWSAPSSPAE